MFWNKNPKHKSGGQFRCHIKKRESHHRWYEANREKELERHRRYYAANAEKQREGARIRREANPEKANEIARRYRERNRDKIGATFRAKYDNDPIFRINRNLKRSRSSRAATLQRMEERLHGPLQNQG